MANVLNFVFGTYDLGTPSQSYTGPESGCQSYVPRGIANELYTVVPPSAGTTRPDYGQMWPRGNSRGNA